MSQYVAWLVISVSVLLSGRDVRGLLYVTLGLYVDLTLNLAAETSGEIQGESATHIGFAHRFR